MAYFRAAISKGPLPEAAGYSALDVATQLRETVLQTSLHLTLKQAQHAGQLDSLSSQLWDR